MNNKRSYWAIGITLILCIPLAVAGARLAIRIIPPGYYAETTLEINDTEPVGPFSYPPPNDPLSRCIAALVKKLRSPEFLYGVIDDLHLPYRWSNGEADLPRDATYAKLQGMISISTVYDRSLIKAGVYSHNAHEAADIANCIAIQLKKYCDEQDQESLSKALSEMQEEISHQQKKVEQAKTELANIGKRDHIDDPNPEAETSGTAGYSDEYSVAKQSFLKETRILDTARIRFKATKESPLPEYLVTLEIVQKAEVPLTPVYPNIKSLIFTGGLAAIIAAVVAVIFLRRANA